MTSLDELLTNYTLEDEYYVNECPCLELNKYDAGGGNSNDIIFQFTICAQAVNDAYVYIHGYQIPVVPKQILFEEWVICLKFPNLAVGALTFGGYVYLYLPGAINVLKVVKISKRFISKDRSLIGNTLLPAYGSISFDLYSQTYTIHNSF